VWVLVTFTVAAVTAISIPDPFSDQSLLTRGTSSRREMLIAVETAPAHEKARKAIRETWMQDAMTSNITTRVRFFIGKVADSKVEAMIAAEADQHKDIIRLNVLEKYENLGQKTLEILGWSADNSFGDVVKVDDDTLLNIHALNNFLMENQPSEWLYAGVIKDDGLVIDDPTSKWYMRDQYPFDTFPQYAFGPCYFVGAAAVRHIADRRRSLPLYRVEDAGVSLWLQGQPLRIQKMPANLYLAACTDSPTLPVFVSPVNEHEMSKLFANIRSGDVCGDRARDPYVLEECQSHRCRCWPPPEDGCGGENFSAEQYADVIPRL